MKVAGGIPEKGPGARGVPEPGTPASKSLARTMVIHQEPCSCERRALGPLNVLRQMLLKV